MNDVQIKLLEIAKSFISVCNKLHLRYFAIGGTALGAARHNGFIPWDNDMDFGMPRSDYEIFVNKAQEFLPTNLFIQTKETDKEYFYPFCKLRNSDTTFVEDELAEFNINHGLWIDIFPIDGLPSSLLKRRLLDFVDTKIFRKRYLCSKFRSKNKRTKITNLIIKIIVPSKQYAYRKSVLLSKKYSYDKSPYFWWNWGSRVLRCFNSSFITETILLDFEDIKIKIPIHFDEYLKAQYGNWHQYPPLSNRNSGHTIIKFDLNTPYYLNKNIDDKKS